MNRIQDWTILHSIGSHKGSSSTIRASAEKTKNNPKSKEKPSPKVFLKTEISQVTFAVIKVIIL